MNPFDFKFWHVYKNILPFLILTFPDLTWGINCDQIVTIENSDKYSYLAHVSFEAPGSLVNEEWRLNMTTDFPFLFIGIASAHSEWRVMVEENGTKGQATFYSVQNVTLNAGTIISFRFRISFAPELPMATPKGSQLIWQGQVICSPLDGSSTEKSTVTTERGKEETNTSTTMTTIKTTLAPSSSSPKTPMDDKSNKTSSEKDKMICSEIPLPPTKNTVPLWLFLSLVVVLALSVIFNLFTLFRQFGLDCLTKYYSRVNDRMELLSHSTEALTLNDDTDGSSI